ncbi:hypothetical protein H0G86_003637 [Trichoderma simmonsii]|uniref:Uncharacterized protein n=1 Tax=Trichoderma simmonsii TaxID=1491479 RepID=A0A8G0PEM0_9HYPO|nr:hypothetical protein H0G86_003637 [Trichoderma simmonsii]
MFWADGYLSLSAQRLSSPYAHAYETSRFDDINCAFGIVAGSAVLRHSCSIFMITSIDIYQALRSQFCLSFPSSMANAQVTIVTVLLGIIIQRQQSMVRNNLLLG